jgi:hypothetical protein
VGNGGIGNYRCALPADHAGDQSVYGAVANGERTRPVQLSYLPLCAVAPATTPIVSARGRYATPRRGELDYEAELWEIAMAFGIPGTWVNVDVANLDAFAETGEVTLPVNVMGWAFTEVEIVYTAGFDPFPGQS